MKNRIVFALFLFGGMLFFPGCTDVFGAYDNRSGSDTADSGSSSGVSVSLSTTTTSGTAQSDFYSDQPFYIRATASGFSGTPSYTWYIDGVEQTDVDSAEVEAALLASSTMYRVIKAVAVYNSEAATASKAVEIRAGASLRIYNRSGYPVTTFYFQPDGYSTFQSTYEELDGSIIAYSTSGYYTLYGILAGTYDMRIENSHSLSATRSDCVFTLGKRWNWYFNSDTNILSENRTGTVDTVLSEDESDYVAKVSEDTAQTQACMQ
jgi:hypothetical protein